MDKKEKKETLEFVLGCVEIEKEEITLEQLLRDKKIVEDELFLFPNDETLTRNLGKINSAIETIKAGGKAYYK